MNDKQLDKLFKEKLESHSTPVKGDGELWDSISLSLDKRVEVRGVLRRRVLYCILSVAAITVVAYFLFAPNSQKPYIKETNENSVLTQNVEQLPNENQPKFQPIEKEQYNVAALTKTQTLTIKTSINQAQNSVPDSLYVAEVGVLSGEDKKSSNSHRITSDFVDLFNFNEFQEEDVAKKGISKYSLAIASNIISGSDINVSSNLSRQSMMSAGEYVTPKGIPNIDRVSQTKYSLPLNLGLQVQLKLNSFLSVGLGVNYTMLRSKYDGLIDKKMYSVKQTLHYVGIPVNLYGTILQKKSFLLYTNLGGSIEKGISAVYNVASYDNRHEYSSPIAGMQYSINVGLGVEYKFIKQIGMYLEPNAVYFFNSKIPNSIRTDQAFQLKAEIGFRFHL